MEKEKDKKYVFMPRIRTIKPEFFKHDELYQAELDFQLPLRIAFIGLWCCADRTGLFKWRPKQLKLDILPYDNVDFNRVLNALMTRGFIVRYAIKEELYGCILSFLDHQTINYQEKRSPIPDYDEKCIVELSEQEIDALETRLDRDEDANSENRQGREGKGREGKRKGRGREEAKKTSKKDDERYGMPLVQVNEKVFLTEKEIQNFIEKFGKENYEWMIEKLKDHVLANRSGERYADDAAAMRGWVAEALEKKLNSKNYGSGKNNQNNKLTADDIQTAYNGVDDICGVI